MRKIEVVTIEAINIEYWGTWAAFFTPISCFCGKRSDFRSFLVWFWSDFWEKSGLILVRNVGVEGLIQQLGALGMVWRSYDSHATRLGHLLFYVCKLLILFLTQWSVQTLTGFVGDKDENNHRIGDYSSTTQLNLLYHLGTTATIGSSKKCH